MKKNIRLRKMIAVFVMAALMTAIVSGCQAGQSTSDSSSKLYDILKSGKLTVGMCMFIPDNSYYDDNGDPAGYDVEVAQALADSLGVELVIEDLDADSRVPSLETDKVDVVIAQFTRTLERAQKIDFTDAYTVSGPAVILPADSKFTSLEDLENKTIGVATGSSHDSILQTVLPSAEISYFDTPADAAMAVSNGQIDACVDDGNSAISTVASNDELKIMDITLGNLDYNCFGVAKGDQIWLNYLNDFIYDFNVTGENAELYEKYYGGEMPFQLNPEF